MPYRNLNDRRKKSFPICPFQAANARAQTLHLLASGSKGNAIYVSNGDTSILIDAGLPGVEIERRMVSRNISVSELTAIIVSHEHSDHIRGVGVLARKHDLPVFISAKTKCAAAAHLGRIDRVSLFSCGSAFSIEGLRIHPFSTSHDADDPVGFTIQCEKQKIGIATDLGVATAMVQEHLKGCGCIVLEANHDLKMLEEGPYPSRSTSPSSPLTRSTITCCSRAPAAVQTAGADYGRPSIGPQRWSWAPRTQDYLSRVTMASPKPGCTGRAPTWYSLKRKPCNAMNAIAPTAGWIGRLWVTQATRSNGVAAHRLTLNSTLRDKLCIAVIRSSALCSIPGQRAFSWQGC